MTSGAGTRHAIAGSCTRLTSLGSIHRSEGLTMDSSQQRLLVTRRDVLKAAAGGSCVMDMDANQRRGQRQLTGRTVT
jgi:hypothetical protein